MPKKDYSAKPNFILLISIVALGFVTLALVLSIMNATSAGVSEDYTYYASVNVSGESSAGFDVNGSALTFGRISIGSSSTRSIIAENKRDYPVSAEISANGSIAPLLSFTDGIMINANEIKKITFSAVSTPSTVPGFYDGEVKIRLVRT